MSVEFIDTRQVPKRKGRLKRRKSNNNKSQENQNKQLHKRVVYRKPRVLFICDYKNWVWYFKSEQLKKHLSNDFSIDIACIFGGDKIDSRRYDIYFTFDYSYVDIEPLKSVPKRKKITGINSYESPSELSSKVNMATAVHVCNKPLLKRLDSIHRKLYYLPNGVDENLFRQLSSIPDSRENLVAGHIGKLSPMRGQLEYVEPAVKKARCLYHPYYKDHTEALSHHIMPSIYKGFDVLVVASKGGRSFNTVLEAAACGRPVIANRTGDIPRIVVDGISGFLVEENVDEYAKKITYLKNNRHILKSMGQNARKIIEKDWTWKIQAENYRKMFWDILGNKKFEEEKTVEKIEEEETRKEKKKPTPNSNMENKISKLETKINKLRDLEDVLLREREVLRLGRI